METKTNRLAVSINEAAAILGISPRSVQKYIASKLLPARKIGRRTLVPLCGLEEFLRNDQPSPSSNQGGTDLG